MKRQSEEMQVNAVANGGSNHEQDAEDYDSFLYRFQQQIISAWKPVPHSSSNIILYLILSIVCITLGIVLIVTAPTTQEVFLRYDNASSPVTFTLNEDLQAPVYLYYGFTNFFQNHRRYLKYFSETQLEDGQQITSDVQDECGKGFVTNSQLNYITTSGSPGDVGFPCGPIAKHYNLFKPQLQSFKLQDDAGTDITTIKTGIAWPSDIGRHKNYDLDKQPFDVTQQNWLVWFRPGARSTFYKLFGRVDSKLPAGSYQFAFTNSYNQNFGEKMFHVSKSNWVGNRDFFLGIAFLVLGGGSLILLVVFIAKWIAERRQRLKFE